MKNKGKEQIVLTLVGLFFVILSIGVVIAQTASQGGGGRQQWVSPSNGITVTMKPDSPSANTNSVIFHYTGTGKNRAPQGTGNTGTIDLPKPKSCPRDERTRDLYSETYDIKDGVTGKVIAQLKIIFNVDCSFNLLTIIGTNDKYTLTKK